MYVSATVPDPHWTAVHQLIDRWAALPAASWQLLIDAEQLVNRTPLSPPRDHDEWMIRDLVQTAWWMSVHRAPLAELPWSEDACRALERSALRLLEVPTSA